MLVRKSRWLALILLLGLPLSCGRFRTTRNPKVPPPAATAPAENPPFKAKPPAAPATEEPKELPPPPEVAGETTVDVPPPLETGDEPPPPPPAGPKTRAEQAPPPKPAEDAPPPAPEPDALPRLTQLLTQEQEWEYNREIDERLLAIEQTVATVEKRSLSGEQMEVLARVRAFVTQTTETRKIDLVTARGLARRAELLVQDLEQSSR